MTIGMVLLAAGLLLADRFFFGRETAGGDRDREASGVEQAQPVGTPVVAVLPFRATGSDDGGFLASGLHDDLLARLAKLEAFRVISRTSMMEYADTSKNMRQIGEELGAGYILEGGVQSQDDRVRVTALLIDAPADAHIWAEVYDRELTAAGLFDIQAELASAIAAQLHTTLSASDRTLISEVPTRSTAAYNAYLRGLDLRETGGFNIENNRAVVAAYEKAVAEDPQFALAWARLSQARTRLAQLSGETELEDAALAALVEA